MTTWDAAYMVALWKKYAGFQDANELNDISDICPYLSRGQQRAMEMIAQRCESLMTAPFAMTPSADRKTFSFGTDGNGNPIMSLGYTQIATTLRAFSSERFFSGWEEGRDFMDEGDKIRMMGDRAYAGPLYARCTPVPPDIRVTGTDADGNIVSVAVQPILNPAAHRELAVIDAVIEWAEQGNQRPDIADTMKNRWKDAFPRAMLTYKRRYRRGGGIIDPAKWYLAAPDLGSTGS